MTPASAAARFDAVSRSAQTWQTQLQACGNLDLDEGARPASRSVGYTQGGANENLVLFRTRLCSAVGPPGDPCLAAETCGNVYDCWDHASTVVALTTSSYIVRHRGAGRRRRGAERRHRLPTVVDSPPCPSGAPSTSCVANDVQNAMTHEFGHFLGLAHSPDPSSTMYANEPLGETSKRVLDSGSKQFVCDVYPQGRASTDCRASSGTGSTRPPAAAAPGAPAGSSRASPCCSPRSPLAGLAPSDAGSPGKRRPEAGTGHAPRP